MPVGGVKESHGSNLMDQNLAKGSCAMFAAASDALVAHAGNGNCTSSGIGISGCETIMVPGFKMLDRARVAAGRNPYSPCCASAVSSLPTTLNDEFATTRLSIWLAVSGRSEFGQPDRRKIRDFHSLLYTQRRADFETRDTREAMFHRALRRQPLEPRIPVVLAVANRKQRRTFARRKPTGE